jgi:hypothetical protein
VGVSRTWQAQDLTDYVHSIDPARIVTLSAMRIFWPSPRPTPCND